MILHAKLLSNTMYVPEGIAPCKEQHLLEKTAFIFIEESLLQMRLKAKMRGMSLKVVHHVRDSMF